MTSSAVIISLVEVFFSLHNELRWTGDQPKELGEQGNLTEGAKSGCSVRIIGRFLLLFRAGSHSKRETFIAAEQRRARAAPTTEHPPTAGR